MSKAITFLTISVLLVILKSTLGNFIIPDIAISKNYCNIKSCAPGTHTMCKYPSPEPSEKCGQYNSTGLTLKEIEQIVRIHNKYRKKVASGNETRGNPGPQYPAQNMPGLSWNHELATIAQRLANQCVFQHDECNSVEHFLVGQNIAILYNNAPTRQDIKKMIKMWYDEVDNFNRDEVKKFVFKPSIGHYTQMVWANTKFIGCGFIRYMEQTLSSFLVCNYGPAGNFINQPIYKIKENIKIE